ncbi:TonB-dependent receptor [Caulobacter sp. UNC358MFTsu5.1]|uniref:TonB-dependent receptor n=1 Tax=Caulobacter sp. UNC358MFTsu5.1 TaxID=1449049 RepID=UPI0004A6F770|nr:TonB-dependent receptor [Caulobacter sp. UNC358MFTsu5.1]
MSVKPHRLALLAACAFSVLTIAAPALAAPADTAASPVAAPADPAAAPTDADDAAVEGLVVTMTKTTRSAVTLGATEMQKILPGINPLGAIQTLPGVSYQTADPWGNNEQNTSLFVHGFSIQQLGFTLDGVPLGDQQYGNYNGLSPQRAVISENVSRVILSSGAGDLGVASTSNLGGAIETFTRDPLAERGGQYNQTLGSYAANRMYLRLETGDLGGGNSAYVSFLHQDQRAWDFQAHQRGNQFNGKFVHDGERGKLTVFADYSKKVEPNEDSIVHPNVGTNLHTASDQSTPYTRPFLYPDYEGALAYLSNAGAPPASAGNNFRNYHSAAQRMDALAYVKYDYKIADNVTWSNQVYFHHDEGRGVVAGPINQAGLPALFAVYYPNQDLKTVFGGTGYAVRTTEYLINRGGFISNADWTLGDHQIQAGVWYEHNKSSTQRAWYPFAASSTDLTPYDIPTNKNFTQYASQIDNDVVQLHVQDQWRIRPDLLLQYGVKSSLQFAEGTVPIQQKNAPGNTNPTLLPSGEIDTKEWFLPQVGAIWDATENEQVFFNIQKNLRQFVTYGAGGLSPWSLGSQAAFDLFKQTAKPETAWTYELGLRTHHELSSGPITGFQAQASVYHVDFSNRLLQTSATPVISSLVAGAAILSNVGSVKTDGVDIAATFNFGSHFSFYDAVSYNRSKYQDDYATRSYVNTAGQTVTNPDPTKPVMVPTAGKSVPNSPEWLNKFVASAHFGSFDAQLVGDYVGKRFATYTNDLSVDSYFLLGLQASYTFQTPAGSVFKSPKISLNVTNLADEKGDLEVVVGQPTNTYNTYPIPPRQVFVTLSTAF